MTSAPLMLGPEPIEIDGKEYVVRSDMVRRRKPPTVQARTQKMLAYLGVLAGLAASRRLRLFFAAGFAGSGVAMALLYTIMRSSKSFSEAITSRLLPQMMAGLDIAMGKVKKELLKDLKGDVLDFGAGDGQYLKYVASQGDKIKSVTSLEPLQKFHTKIEERAKALGVPFKGVYKKYSADLLRERGPEQFDTIIVGCVLCEVPDQHAAVKDLYQLLRPGGKLFYIEHVAYEEGTLLNYLQQFINPFWRVVSGGCNCNRHTLRAIRSAPWNVFTWELLTDVPLLNRMQTGLAVKEDLANPDIHTPTNNNARL
mmetsp:Transcript_12973/g.25158  ORF Transcript_12973/g.25158 Transcript_12973/m.25158 type:complete len:311 (-) Transcript_12973:202-1134(-)|eukprot:CAMPEP_0171491202 /NCGR_PEP_ID=MMETSP0958-20121227/3731_1 /TAXON_ID=87120 /ORGANISM="Aurantiochytrium limacinum, Strain ATCCMYA-1381" /LENGTH=310 /DNA_ID=CAMNT_0012024599 /DNA_START=194 /DNA_END=1126 /DNA_ORIENTATION=+